MVLHIVRAIFVLAVLAIAVSYSVNPEIRQSAGKEGLSPVTKVTLVIVIPVSLAVLLMLADISTERKSLGSVSGLFFGVVAGAVLAYILGLVVELGAAVFMPKPMAESTPDRPALRLPRAALPTATAPATAPARGPLSDELAELRAQIQGLRQQLSILWEEPTAEEAQAAIRSRSALVAMIKLLVGACTIYLCVSFVMQTKEDFRFIIPYVEFARQRRGTRPLLLDTSVIIDGRIADITDTRILASPMIVPRFVLE